MTNAADPTEVLRTVAASLGLSATDLHRIADQLDAPTTPTIAVKRPGIRGGSDVPPVLRGRDA